MLLIFSRPKVFYPCRWDQMLLPFPSVFPFTLNCIAPDKNFRFDLAIRFFFVYLFCQFPIQYDFNFSRFVFFLAVGLVLFCFHWCGSCLRVQMCNKAKITEILFSVNRRGNLREKVCNLCEHKKRIPFIFYTFPLFSTNSFWTVAKTMLFWLVQSVQCNLILYRCCSL